MSYRSLNLHLFTFSDNDQVTGLIEMWHSLDSDYEETLNLEEMAGFSDLDEIEKWMKKGYNNMAEAKIKELFKTEYNDDDLSRIEEVIEWMSLGHGSHSDQFAWQVHEDDDHNFCIAVAYMT